MQRWLVQHPRVHLHFTPTASSWLNLVESWFARLYPHGGNVRYLLRPDGSRILATRRMHNSILELALPDSMVAGYHTAIVDDVPEDSDVFLVLTRRPPRRELLVSACCYYEVRLDGTIDWRPREDADPAR